MHIYNLNKVAILSFELAEDTGAMSSTTYKKNKKNNNSNLV